jgi:hypothetical protein
VSDAEIAEVHWNAGAEQIEALRKAIHSTEYPCPGGHRLDGVRGDSLDYADEMMDELGYPADWDFDRLAVEHPEEYRQLRDKQAENWVERGKCGKPIEIYLESDGEYGEIRYPVAEGDCVKALGMDEDFEYERPLWQRAFERWNLERLVRRIPVVQEAAS